MLTLYETGLNVYQHTFLLKYLNDLKPMCCFHCCFSPERSLIWNFVSLRTIYTLCTVSVATTGVLVPCASYREHSPHFFEQNALPVLALRLFFAPYFCFLNSEENSDDKDDRSFLAEFLHQLYLLIKEVINLINEAAHENEPRLAVPSCHGGDQTP